MAVNLSARQFRDAGLVASVQGALDRSGMAAEWLELELTESMLMDGETHRHTLDQLAEAGVRVAIDDFGTGYSSLSYLKRLRVDTLKVDRSFVQGLPDNPEDAAISTAVIALGRSLGLRVVAEGVETRAQRSFLRRQGCDEIQGYLLSRPVPPEVFAAWWREALERRAEGLATQF
jgi:EAL domain-containing protein (putative c-di-GMP-specific phosphodiesterase class I)